MDEWRKELIKDNAWGLAGSIVLVLALVMESFVGVAVGGGMLVGQTMLNMTKKEKKP